MPAAIASPPSTDAGAVVAAGEHEHGMADRAEPVLDLDRAVVGDREVPQHVGRVDAAGGAALELLDARVERVGEVERELVVQQRRAVLLRLRLGLARPRRA